MPTLITCRTQRRAYPALAAAALLLGVSGLALLAGCSTVGAIPGVAIPSAGATSTPAPPASVVPPSAPPAAAKAADPSAYLVTFTTRLAGSNEVPQTASMGTGTVDALLDTRTGLLRWKLSYSNLSGPVGMAHFHGPAATGVNAGVALAFPMPLTSPYEGRAMLTLQQMTDLMAGEWYANVHTAQHPAGEVRGQMIERR